MAASSLPSSPAIVVGASSAVAALTALATTDDLADCQLIVKDVVIPAHKLVLAMASPVLRQSLIDRKESKVVVDATPEHVRIMLQSMYGVKVQASSSDVSPLLALAAHYRCAALSAICGSEITKMTASKVWPLLHSLPGEVAVGATGTFIDAHAKEILTDEQFATLPKSTVSGIVARDTLPLPEPEIWTAVLGWAEAELKRTSITSSPEALRTVLSGILPLIRFPLMEMTYLAVEITGSGVLTGDEMLAVFSYVGNTDAAVRAALAPTVPFPITKRLGGSEPLPDEVLLTTGNPLSGLIVGLDSPPFDGARVVRGRDWTYGNQDGDPPTGGSIQGAHESSPGWHRVRWDSGGSNSYRTGSDGSSHYDLYFE